jgi:hypothetical protein
LSSAHIRLAAAAPPPPKTLATTHFRIATIIIPTTSIDRCHPHPHYRRHNLSPDLGFISLFRPLKKKPKKMKTKEGTWGRTSHPTPHLILS